MCADVVPADVVMVIQENERPGRGRESACRQTKSSHGSGEEVVLRPEAHRKYAFASSHGC